MGRTAGRIWVASTTSLISFIGFSSQLGIILPAHSWNWRSPELLRILIPFNLLLYLVFYNYFACVRTDPGGVPRGWAPDKREAEDGAVEVKRLTGGPRFCRTCKEFKPPRAHHCRQCKKCVLKMDHHCPWVNNCVGYNNHGHFIRFLFWVDVACAYHLWMISCHAFKSLAYTADPSLVQIFTLIFNYTACVPVLVAVGSFSVFHFWSIARNTTTIEGHEKDKVAVLKRKGKIREFKYPYTLGVKQNVSSVLGPNPFLWCWPQPMYGSGLKYPVAMDLDAEDQYSWPPRDSFAPSKSYRSISSIRRDPAFTYSRDGLNPSLMPTSSASTTLRNRRPHSFNTHPYDPDFSDDSSSSEEGEPPNQWHAKEEANEESDDDVPLGRIAARRAQGNMNVPRLPRLLPTDPPPAVRVRRGSEGVEIRPRMTTIQREEGSEEENDSEVDDEGNRITRGPRYSYYRREDEDTASSEEYSTSDFESSDD